VANLKLILYTIIHVLIAGAGAATAQVLVPSLFTVHIYKKPAAAPESIAHEMAGAVTVPAAV
jgi:hypothetical protein